MSFDNLSCLISYSCKMYQIVTNAEKKYLSHNHNNQENITYFKKLRTECNQ